MSQRPLRRREILRDRKAQLAVASTARLARMTWSGKGGTFTLGPGSPAIEVIDWSIEIGESQATAEMERRKARGLVRTNLDTHDLLVLNGDPDATDKPVGVLNAKSSPCKIYRPEAN